MQYELINATDAPAKPKEMSKRARASLALINALTLLQITVSGHRGDYPAC